MDFSGTNKVTIKTIFENITNNFTYEFWVKPRVAHQITEETITRISGLSGQRYVIGAGNTGTKNSAGVGISIGTNGVSVFEHSPNYLPSLLVYSAAITNWTHIAVVYNNKTPYLYINGEFKKRGLKSPKSDVYPSGVFGGHQYGFFVGQIKELRLWDHARSTEQIKVNLHSELSEKENGLFGFWKMAEDDIPSRGDQEANLKEDPNTKITNINSDSPDNSVKHGVLNTTVKSAATINNIEGVLKVSCILTSYNRPKGVLEAIESVQAQTYPHWELIIVDDNSNEQTQKVLKEIVEKDARCRLIQSGVRANERSKTTRYATCINMALPYVIGDLVTYLTDDDIYYPKRFEKMVEIFQNNPQVQVAYGKQRVVILSKNKVVREFLRTLVGITRSPMGKIDHNSFMHRRSCLNTVKRWDDNPAYWKYADAIFFNKLAKYWPFYPLNVITDEHRVHDKGVQRKMSRGLKPWNELDAE